VDPPHLTIPASGPSRPSSCFADGFELALVNGSYTVVRPTLGASRGELTAHGEYVGIDYHRRRSLPVRRDESGASLGVARVVNDPLVLAAELAKAGPEPGVANRGDLWLGTRRGAV
jgi:hypothetical protein